MAIVLQATVVRRNRVSFTLTRLKRFVMIRANDYAHLAFATAVIGATFLMIGSKLMTTSEGMPLIYSVIGFVFGKTTHTQPRGVRGQRVQKQ